MDPNLRLTHYLFLLRKAENSPYGMQLRPYEAGELADQIGELIAMIRDLEIQIEQWKMGDLYEKNRQKSVPNGGKP